MALEHTNKLNKNKLFALKTVGWFENTHYPWEWARQYISEDGIGKFILT